ncbi:dihydrofolate reductase [Nocardioides guangzhouensis]|uniref:Dihydrofolate reductase n=1 Tax=Nocardioides guangzhouensis TaxID=2497878 RepID=A0A4Q4ZIR5_9ACTN|nr:dihydrofolate reductase family protein [Nocardioides guangzhouensis]RYP87254.1 dihydrofolate reductase [Nocardioides guangzhouensis]
MSKVIATITMSVDGYVTGPDDGPGCGLGVGGERLHYWVMGGPWTYDNEHEPGTDMEAADKAFFASLTGSLGAGICGRGMYESAGAWGGTNPFDGPLFVLTHRIADQPDPSAGFTFVDGFDAALAAAREAAGDKDVAISGGADTIRQALRAGVVDTLAVSTAPVVLGAGKRLFDGFTDDLELAITAVHHSTYAVHTVYDVLEP